jgi:hypothetical protein
VHLVLYLCHETEQCAVLLQSYNFVFASHKQL